MDELGELRARLAELQKSQSPADDNFDQQAFNDVIIERMVGDPYLPTCLPACLPTYQQLVPTGPT